MNYGFLPTFCLSVVLFFSSALLHAEQSMLVLDASGSMWGQIDGLAPTVGLGCGGVWIGRR